MIDLTINTDLASKILTGFIHTEITRAGFSRAVIGLSRGLDSSLSCYLAAEALGPKNVLAFSAARPKGKLPEDAAGMQDSAKYLACLA